MKRISIFAFFATLILSANAADLWTETKHVSWETGGCDLEAAKFTEAQAGNLLKVHYSNAATNLEFKVMGEWHPLPGACYEAWIEGGGTYNQYLTATAVTEIKEHGLQVIGGGLDVTKIELLEGRAAEVQKEGAIWTGYFWADNWSLLKLDLQGLRIDWSKYKEIIIYHQANRTDYIVNVLSQFDVEGAKVPDDAVTKNANEVVVDLTKFNISEIISVASENDQKSLKFQFHKEEGEAFNVTDIVLVPKTNTTALENIVVESNTIKTIENGQIVIIKDNVRYNVLGVKL